MGAPFDFSALFRDPSAQSYLSGIESLYRQPVGDYFDPEDPRYQQYTDLAAQAPPSEGILSSFMNEMPNREDYQPSSGKKIGGFLLGMLSGMRDPSQAYRTTREFVEAPYTRALTDWNQEGKFVDDRARLADAARNRELGTLKFGLEQSSRAKRYKALDEQKAQGLAERTSKAATGFTGKEVDREDKQNQNEVLNSLRQLALQLQQSRLDLSREGLDFRKDQEEWDRAHPGAGRVPPKPVDPLKHEAENLANEEKIKESIKERIMDDPKYSQYFDPNTGGFRPDVDPKVQKDLMDLVEGEFQKRLIVLRGGR